MRLFANHRKTFVGRSVRFFLGVKNELDAGRDCIGSDLCGLLRRFSLLPIHPCTLGSLEEETRERFLGVCGGRAKRVVCRKNRNKLEDTEYVFAFGIGETPYCDQVALPNEGDVLS